LLLIIEELVFLGQTWNALAAQTMKEKRFGIVFITVPKLALPRLIASPSFTCQKKLCVFRDYGRALFGSNASLV
jgi:hypothetical protein